MKEADTKQMEKKRYTVPVTELEQHLSSHGVPQDAVIHYWYEVDSTPANDEQAKSTDDWKVKLRALSGIWEDHEDAQEDFQQIRKSLNNRIPN